MPGYMHRGYMHRGHMHRGHMHRGHMHHGYMHHQQSESRIHALWTPSWIHLRGSRGLSARRARRTKSRGPKGLQLEVGVRRAPRLLMSYIFCSALNLKVVFTQPPGGAPSQLVVPGSSSSAVVCEAAAAAASSLNSAAHFKQHCLPVCLTRGRAVVVCVNEVNRVKIGRRGLVGSKLSRGDMLPPTM